MIAFLYVAVVFLVPLLVGGITGLVASKLLRKSEWPEYLDVTFASLTVVGFLVALLLGHFKIMSYEAAFLAGAIFYGPGLACLGFSLASRLRLPAAEMAVGDMEGHQS